jgi:hypothetical protein
VQHTLVVRGGKARTELPRDVQRLRRGQSSNPPQQRSQILPVDVLHRQERPGLPWALRRPRLCRQRPQPFDLADVVNPAHVRMRDRPGAAHLRQQAITRSRIPLERRRQELQRDRLSEPQIIGAIDLPHAAPPHERDDPVALGEDRAGGEAPDREWRG